jgi:hypothetical protein
MPISITSIRPKRFQLIDPDRAVVNVRRSQRRYLQAVAARLAIYPPQHPGSKYKRTYKLQGGWKNPNIEVSSDGSTATMVNPVAWAVYANGPKGGSRGIGERQSRRMRALGWPSITDVARELRPLYSQLMNRSIRGAPGDTF